jgi:glycosyltransferase involved in cell wall biosynthesis
MRILQVSTSDFGGGAETVARALSELYRHRGHESWLAVGWKRTTDDTVVEIPKDALHKRATRNGRPRQTSLPSFSQARRWLDVYRGREDFDFPGTWSLPNLPPQAPDIIHCHNLHGAWLDVGGYFDLRALPLLSADFPLVLTLHDAWLLSGHCAHSFDCERWRNGCGSCPDLEIYPAVRRDATTYNWRRKREIYARSRLHVATPCEWLMRKVEQSILAPGVSEARIVPYGVDLELFAPSPNRRLERRELGLPPDARVLLFVATNPRTNPWKDYAMLNALQSRVAHERHDAPIVFLMVGESAPSRRVGLVEMRFVEYESDRRRVARLYRCADVYIHPARADTFPNAVLEALATGLPVIATAVGGIPEQVRGLSSAGPSNLNGYDASGATGVLVSPSDVVAMHQAVSVLLGDQALRACLGANARRDAQHRFDSSFQAEAYLGWYQELIARCRLPQSTVGRNEGHSLIGSFS